MYVFFENKSDKIIIPKNFKFYKASKKNLLGSDIHGIKHSFIMILYEKFSYINWRRISEVQSTLVHFSQVEESVSAMIYISYRRAVESIY